MQLKRSEVKRKRSRIASSTSEGRTFHRSTHASFKRQRTLTEFNIPTSSNLPVRSSSYSLSRFDLPTSNKNIEPVIIDDNDHKSVCLDNAGKVEIIIDTDEEDLVLSLIHI